jgi:DNA-binding XRE family transcriptional regulator
VEGVLSEGQLCQALDLDRIEFRALCDMLGNSARTLGEKVFFARHHAGLTQQEVADCCGVTRPQIANIEGNRSDVPITTLRRLAQALGVKAADLLPEDDAPVAARAAGSRVAAQVDVTGPGRDHQTDPGEAS